MSDLEALENRLSSIVNNFCNPIGCDECPLKYGFDSKAECSATDLNGKIMELEIFKYQPKAANND